MHMGIPQKSHSEKVKLTTVPSWAHPDPVPGEEHSRISVSLMEMASDLFNAFPQKQLERFPMFSIFFQI